MLPLFLLHPTWDENQAGQMHHHLMSVLLPKRGVRVGTRRKGRVRDFIVPTGVFAPRGEKFKYAPPSAVSECLRSVLLTSCLSSCESQLRVLTSVNDHKNYIVFLCDVRLFAGYSRARGLQPFPLRRVPLRAGDGGERGDLRFRSVHHAGVPKYDSLIDPPPPPGDYRTPPRLILLSDDWAALAAQALQRSKKRDRPAICSDPRGWYRIDSHLKSGASLYPPGVTTRWAEGAVRSTSLKGVYWAAIGFKVRRSSEYFGGLPCGRHECRGWFSPGRQAVGLCVAVT